MNDDAFRLLSVRRLPGRLTAGQVACLLNCAEHDLPALLKAKLLKPLGHPAPNAVKFFATADVLQQSADRAWLAKVTQTICGHWQAKNARKKTKPPESPSPADTEPAPG